MSYVDPSTNHTGRHTNSKFDPTNPEYTISLRQLNQRLIFTSTIQSASKQSTKLSLSVPITLNKHNKYTTYSANKQSLLTFFDPTDRTSTSKIAFFKLLSITDDIIITRTPYFVYIELFPLELILQIRTRRDGTRKLRYLSPLRPQTLSNSHSKPISSVTDLTNQQELYLNLADIVILICILYRE